MPRSHRQTHPSSHMDVGTDEGDIVQTPLMYDKVTHCMMGMNVCMMYV